jgi:hypothetical protein
MSEDDENGDEVDAGTWTKVASGELGDVVYWETGFEALGEVQSILSQLEEVGEENVDWKSLIGEHSYFAGIKNADFSPLYNECDFEVCFDDFLAIVEEPEEYGMPGQSFDSLNIYVANDEKEKVLQEFTNFLQHLKTLKPLRDAGIV